MHHYLHSSPETVHWGWFDAALPHVLTINSGDRVTIESLSGGPANLPGEGFHVPAELLEVHATSQRRLPGHILTGPVAVRGAEPGDVLEIRIVDVQLRQDWGYTFVRPLAGALPSEVDGFEQIVTRLDSERNVGLLPWGLEIDLAHRPAKYLQSATFHPTFLYESLWLVLTYIVITRLEHRHRLGRGQATALYAALYTFERFWIELLRVDPASRIFGVRFNALLSAAICVAALAWLCVLRSHERSSAPSGSVR